MDDLVRGLIALMNSDYDGPVNIGNPDEYTVKEFAEVRSPWSCLESSLLECAGVAGGGCGAGLWVGYLAFLMKTCLIIL